VFDIVCFAHVVVVCWDLVFLLGLSQWPVPVFEYWFLVVLILVPDSQYTSVVLALAHSAEFIRLTVLSHTTCCMIQLELCVFILLVILVSTIIAVHIILVLLLFLRFLLPGHQGLSHN
jgi:hypothetical protein